MDKPQSQDAAAASRSDRGNASIATRIYIMGASGSGVSTLGSRLSERLSLSVLDVDDYYWMPTDPPFTTKRPVDERIAMLRDYMPAEGWILAGSLEHWGQSLLREADNVFFVYTPRPTRVQRLQVRQYGRFGARIEPGGDMHEDHLEFMAWASAYDDDDDPDSGVGRTLAFHETFVRKLSVPVTRLDGGQDGERILEAALFALKPKA